MDIDSAEPRLSLLVNESSANIIKRHLTSAFINNNLLDGEVKMSNITDNLGALMSAAILDNPERGALLLEAFLAVQPDLKARKNVLSTVLCLVMMRVAHLDQHIDQDRSSDIQAVAIAGLLDDVNRMILEHRLDNANEIVSEVQCELSAPF